MTQNSFTASVEAWVKETEARMSAVRKEAAQRVIEIMQTPIAKGGNLPVDTGFLRASLMAVTGPSQLPSRPNPGVPMTYDAGHVSLVIAGAKPSETITVAYTANYARHQEYGSNGRAGRRFVALAAQQWPRIVREVATEAHARAGK